MNGEVDSMTRTQALSYTSGFQKQHQFTARPIQVIPGYFIIIFCILYFCDSFLQSTATQRRLTILSLTLCEMWELSHARSREEQAGSSCPLPSSNTCILDSTRTAEATCKISLEMYKQQMVNTTLRLPSKVRSLCVELIWTPVHEKWPHHDSFSQLQWAVSFTHAWGNKRHV